MFVYFCSLCWVVRVQCTRRSYQKDWICVLSYYPDYYIRFVLVDIHNIITVAAAAVFFCPGCIKGIVTQNSGKVLLHINRLIALFNGNGPPSKFFYFLKGTLSN